MASRRRKPRSKKPSSNKSHSDSSSLPAKQGKAAVAELVKDLPDSEKIELAKELTVSRVETTFSGPLPTPQDFQKYSEVLSDAPDRIMRMAEREQQIRAEGQKGMLANERWKLNLGALLGVALLVVSGIAAWRGQGSIAIPLGLAGTFALIIRLLDKWISHLFGKDE